MELSKIVAALAMVLTGILVSEHARAEKEPARDSASREAARRVAIAEHQKRKLELTRLCSKPVMSNAEMDACRAAYRRL
jgi:hypothetical protein